MKCEKPVKNTIRTMLTNRGRIPGLFGPHHLGDTMVKRLMANAAPIAQQIQVGIAGIASGTHIRKNRS